MYFNDAWISRIKPEVGDNWRLKVSSCPGLCGVSQSSRVLHLDSVHISDVLSLVSDQQPEEDSERHPGLQPGGKKKLLQPWSVRQEQSHDREQDGF